MALGSAVGHKATTLPFLGACTDHLINQKGGHSDPSPPQRPEPVSPTWSRRGWATAHSGSRQVHRGTVTPGREGCAHLLIWRGWLVLIPGSQPINVLAEPKSLP